MAGIRKNLIQFTYNIFSNLFPQNKCIAVANITPLRHFLKPSAIFRASSTKLSKWYSTFDQKTTDSTFTNETAGKKSSSPFDDATAAGNSNNEEEEDKEEKAKREASWRTMKLGLVAIGSSATVLGGFLMFSLGAPRKDENGVIIEDRYSDLPIAVQYFKRMFSQLDYYNRMIKEPSRSKLLPDPVKLPYIQPPYTLVLELTDLLVHPEWTYSTGWRFKKRPGLDHFLQKVGPPLFEVVVYTAEQGMTAYPLLDSLDPNGYISYRLFRDATDFDEGHHVKNLDCLNRNLKRVIVVDWNTNSVKKHPANCLVVPRWKGTDEDTTLVDLATFLRTIALNRVDDVRNVLQFYSQFENPVEAFRENQRKLLEQIEQKEEEVKEMTKCQPLASRWSNYFNKSNKA